MHYTADLKVLKCWKAPGGLTSYTFEWRIFVQTGTNLMLDMYSSPNPKGKQTMRPRQTRLIHNPFAASGTIRFNGMSTESHQPFKPLHGKRQCFIEFFNDPAGRVQAAVLQLERVAVALVKTGQTGELRRQQGAVVERHDVGRSALLGESAQRSGGRSGGCRVQDPWRDANHHLLRGKRGRVLPPGHTWQLHWLARIWRQKKRLVLFHTQLWTVKTWMLRHSHSAQRDGIGSE